MRSSTSPHFPIFPINLVAKHSLKRRARKAGRRADQVPTPAATPRTASERYATAAEGMVEASLALEGYTRTVPDPGARNGGPRWVADLVMLFTALFAILTLPYWIARYYIVHPRGFNSLGGYLMCRGMATTLTMYVLMPPRETEHKRANKRQILPMGDVIKLVHVTEVRIPPSGPETTRPPCRPIITPIPLPGYMLCPPGAPIGIEPARNGEKIILYFHGGGYVDGHPLQTPFAYKIARDTRTRVFAATYRKVLDERSAFPAPVIDANAAWDYVLSLGFAPKSILLMGDSAGGHLCLYLTQRLAVSAAMFARLDPSGHPEQRLPGGLALLSPWVDLTMGFPSWHSSRDYLPFRYSYLATRAALRHYSPDAANHPPLSPVFAPEGYWRPLAAVPVFVAWGQNESMADEVRTFVQGLVRDSVDVSWYEIPDGLHVGPTMPWSNPSEYNAFAHGLKDVLAAM